MDHDKAARRALLVAKALKHHASVIHNPASIMGNPPPPVARYGMVSPHLTQIAPVARAAGGSADPAFTDADATAQMKYIQDPNIAMPANQVDQDIEGGGYADGGDVNADEDEEGAEHKASGGMTRMHPALSIPGVHIRTAKAGEPFFHGEK